MVEQEKSFSNTVEFVKAAYENSFVGEFEMDQSRIDRNKPYTRIGDTFYQAEFTRIRTHKGDLIPLIASRINPEFPDKFAPKQEDEASVRRPNAAILYIMGKDQNEYQSLEEIGDLYHVTREMIRMDVKNHVSDLHRTTSRKLQLKHPFDSFSFKKELPIKSYLRQIAKRIDLGADYAKLREEFFTPSQITYARKALGPLGYNIELQLTPLLPRFEGLTNPEATDDQIQALLEKISDNSQVNALRKAGLIVNFKIIADKAGIYGSNRHAERITQSLEQAFVPQTSVVYKRGRYISSLHILAAIHEDRAINTLLNDRHLDDLRIKNVA